MGARFDNFKEKIEEFKVKRFLSAASYILSHASDKKIIQMLNFVKAAAPEDDKPKFELVINAFKKKHPSLLLAKRAIKNTNKNCRKKAIINLIGGFALNAKKSEKIEKKEGFRAPVTVLISPTMRCNLRCRGCYASNYSREDDLPLQTIDRVITEAKELGVCFFTMLGGEPFIRKDMIKIYSKHNDAYFQVYTNGTLINENAAKMLVKLGNVIPMISIEGFEKETDSRRGKGVYDKIIKAMEILKKYKVPFGISCCVERSNVETILSDEFIDMIIKKGALVGWLFLYMPVGEDPSLQRMPTPKQRIWMLKRVNELRNTKPIFLIDFWNDAPHVSGCIAGKSYIHITSKGDVEPCIFTHFAVDNVKNKSLKQALNSGFFKEIRKRQPFNKNLFMPCMWIDNPKVGREIHKICSPYPTHPGADKCLKDAKIRKGIDKYAKEISRLYGPVWKKYEEERIKRQGLKAQKF